MLLLPASVDDYMTVDNPVRFIAAFVADHAKAEARVPRGGAEGEDAAAARTA